MGTLPARRRYAPLYTPTNMKEIDMADDDEIRGWRAAAKVAGRSVAGMQKLAAAGKVTVGGDGEGALFSRAELKALPPVAVRLVGAAGVAVVSTEAADAAPAEDSPSPAPAMDDREGAAAQMAAVPPVAPVHLESETAPVVDPRLAPDPDRSAVLERLNEVEWQNALLRAANRRRDEVINGLVARVAALESFRASTQGDAVGFRRRISSIEQTHSAWAEQWQLERAARMRARG